MFFMSCKTTEKTVYCVPEINFPEFPELGEYEKIEGNKIATDEDYFRRLLVFRTLYLTECEKYNAMKNELQGESK